MQKKVESPKIPEELTNFVVDSLATASESAGPDEEAERLLQDAPKIQYEDKFVAFVDLLGFRQIVMRTSKHVGTADETQFKTDTREEIHGALSSIPHDDYISLFNPRYLEGTAKAGLGLGVAGFSDTLIFWCDQSPEAFGLLVHAVFQTVRQFTLRGFYCRGGIKLGELLIDDAGFKARSRTTPVMFGPAFVGAFDLEHKNANEGRIILCNHSTRLVKEYRSTAQPAALRKFFEDYLFQSKDGPWQVDIFADFRTPKIEEAGALLTQIETIGRKLKRVMDEYTESPTVYRKLLAVAVSFNRALEVGGTVIEKFNDHIIPVPASR